VGSELDMQALLWLQGAVLVLAREPGCSLDLFYGVVSVPYFVFVPFSDGMPLLALCSFCLDLSVVVDSWFLRCRCNIL
jgi:hypothetical protein